MVYFAPSRVPRPLSLVIPQWLPPPAISLFLSSPNKQPAHTSLPLKSLNWRLLCYPINHFRLNPEWASASSAFPCGRFFMCASLSQVMDPFASRTVDVGLCNRRYPVYMVSGLLLKPEFPQRFDLVVTVSGKKEKIITVNGRRRKLS